MDHSESIIISKRTFREADLLVTFFSKKDGKLKGVARSAKKSKKRFGGLLECGYILDLHYKTTTSSDLCSITQANLLVPKIHRPQSMAETSSLWIAMELVSKFLPDAEVSDAKFELVSRFIRAIHQGRLNRFILIYFLLKWFSLCGYLPDFSDERIISGIGYKMNGASIEIIRSILKGDNDPEIDDAIFSDIIDFIFHYARIIIGKPLEVAVYKPMVMEL